MKPPLYVECAIAPPPVPTLASTGSVVREEPLARKPNKLICPPGGGSNSIVPRVFAVTGYWLSSMKYWCPRAGIESVAVPIGAPVSARMITLTFADCAATLAIAWQTAYATRIG